MDQTNLYIFGKKKCFAFSMLLVRAIPTTHSPSLSLSLSLSLSRYPNELRNCTNHDVVSENNIKQWTQPPLTRPMNTKKKMWRSSPNHSRKTKFIMSYAFFFYPVFPKPKMAKWFYHATFVTEWPIFKYVVILIFLASTILFYFFRPVVRFHVNIFTSVFCDY